MSRARRPEAAHRPMYARMLRLRHITPSGFLCFVFLEGTIALGALLALAELVTWWGVLVLPATVAMMVKLNDVIAGALTAASARAARPASARAEVLRPATVTAPAPRVAEEATTRLPGVINRDRGAPIMRPWAEQAEAHQQRVRQSASRRYE